MQRLKGTIQYYSPPQPIAGCTNVLAINYDNGAVVDDGSCEFTPATIYAIINDALPLHAEITKQAFDDNSVHEAIIFNNTEEDLFEYANAIGTEVMIRSYVGLYSHIPLATQYYPDVLLFMPLGSNSNIELTNPPTLSVIVSCGAGLTNQNQTGYGNGLEFWDVDTYGSVNPESSYTNPIVAAKLLAIKEARQCDWWTARYCARITADRTEVTHPNEEYWNKNNGFGKINVENAIAFNGSIPEDPFINNGNVFTPFI